MYHTRIVDLNCFNCYESKNGLPLFPKPPIHLIPSTKTLTYFRSDSICSGVSDYDSTSDDENITIIRKKPMDIRKLLPPIGVFWDIENCHVPKGKSATAVAQAIRDRFFVGYREADFIVVCDVTKEKSRIIQELNDAQVNLIHVAATCKNAADEKLRQSIRRFADTHSAPAAIILISGDVNFAGDLNDLRHRKKIHVILVHHSNVSKALVLCASEHYSFADLVEKIPMREIVQNDNTLYEVIVSNLPEDKEPAKVKCRLKQLCENSGGRVGFITKTLCSIKFPTIEFAARKNKYIFQTGINSYKPVENLHGTVETVNIGFYYSFPFLNYCKCENSYLSVTRIRGKKRMDGENVFGNKIIVSDPMQMEDWNWHVRRNKKNHGKKNSEMMNGCGALIRKQQKEDNGFHFNDIHSYKPYGNNENNLAHSQNIDPSFHQQLTKNMVPFFSNNISNFTFPKVPNIENLKVIQNPTSHALQKSYMNNNNNNNNNLDDGSMINGGSSSSSNSSSSVKKNGTDNRKFNNNNLNNHGDGLNSRLNNAVFNSSTPNGENGFYSYDNNQQLYLAQAHQLQMLTQNSSSYGQRNVSSNVQDQMSSSSSSSSSLSNHLINRGNGSGGGSGGNGGNFGGGRLIRGTHGGNNNLNFSNTSRSGYSDEGCDSFISNEQCFEPVQKPECSSPVYLHVSGLDPHMDLISAKTMLTNSFKMHVEVLSVSVFCLSDGSLVASVKVPSFQDAQYAISQLQRRRFGSRRITIAFQNISRSQVAQLLSEIPQNKTPLFRFTELFKSRFLNSVSVSELNKMKDVCVITEEDGGRMITANTRSQISSYPNQEKKEATVPYCQLHSHKTLSDSELPLLPSVNISLKLLTSRILSLLESHGGKLFLPSLADCYQSQFGPLPEDVGGVPLEHLVSCIPGVDMSQSHGSVKYLTWATATSQPNDENVKCVSPMLVGTMSVFTRELLDLLKDTPKCLLPFSQFIPSYHRKYGRQCRVSDYGYTKLLDLLESMPHILQVIGNGTYKIVTLSHKTQIRRFTTDLLRILKNQTNRQIDLKDFGVQYEKIFGRTWDPTYYGLCELEDLINCAPQSAIVMENKEDGKILISIPKREQTPEELELTKKFAQEVVELLKRVPNCSMEFNKFVPAYHSQFGRQCRVSSYGCFKLIELFESIPETVTIHEDASRGEKYLILTPAKKLQVFAERVCSILSAKDGVMLLFRLEFAYQFYQYESLVAPSDCGCETFEQVLMKIPEYVKLEDSRNGRLVILIHNTDPVVLIPRVRFILLNQDKLTANQFVKAYTQQYQNKIDLDADLNKIPEAVKVVKKGGETYVQLTLLSVFANQMYLLLSDHKGRIRLYNFESFYQNKFKKPCLPSQFGYPTLTSLLSAIPETVTVQNNEYCPQKRVITLNVDLKSAGFRIPTFNNGNSKMKETDTVNGSDNNNKQHRSYDLWQSDSLFPCWNDINGFTTENITVPHPSELPLPSAKLASPVQKMLQLESGGYRNEVEATSTTGENIPGMSRIAAHFDNLI
ncbi:conserved hypothetical protein [Pediculus humanus corporis]|uniref:HTH OST-type domain-containing protein n=1 Tax=Pediculus humanus subsp. corporis TaxID=121224 RepID=E0VN41_PEDHC|nr:uncharacterized protein Phum_PHUM328160 [Pediculus humanus corporis]EEB14807.1 conserved hypothetical protein [Pediculus humanus corporis]